MMNSEMISVELQTLLDKQAVIEAVNGMVAAAERKDWQACRAAFADTVLLDHDAHKGAEPVQLSADEIIAEWKSLFSRFDATLHAVTNHHINVEENSAVCDSYVFALHHDSAVSAGENHYTTYGSYRHTLKRTSKGWHITSMQYRQLYATGNPGIFTVKQAASESR